MRCSRCGAENAPGSNVCAACGTPFAQATPVAPVAPVFVAAPTVPGKGLGIASMVCCILSIIPWCFNKPVDKFGNCCGVCVEVYI